jgi:sugar phosphate isomerase/epimerase
MRLAFSTLGCPNWGLEQVAEAAAAHGFDAIELRALAGGLDLLGRPEFAPERVGATRAWLEGHGLRVCCVDTSCSFDSADADERRAQERIAVDHCALAIALGAPLIRVFPDRIPEGATREATRDRIVESLREVALRAPDGVRVGLETHGDFAHADATAEIVELVAHPKVAVIWDVANALAAGSPVREAALALAPLLAHVHLRDAMPVEGREHWLPVLAGRGAVPFAEAVAALGEIAYDGFVSFEWEKYWNPEIEEPDVALPDFAAAMRRISGTTVGRVGGGHE